jgi:hypothetical protein
MSIEGEAERIAAYAGPVGRELPASWRKLWRMCDFDDYGLGQVWVRGYPRTGRLVNEKRETRQVDGVLVFGRDPNYEVERILTAKLKVSGHLDSPQMLFEWFTDDFSGGQRACALVDILGRSVDFGFDPEMKVVDYDEELVYETLEGVELVLTGDEGLLMHSWWGEITEGFLSDDGVDKILENWFGDWMKKVFPVVPLESMGLLASRNY